MYYQRISEQMKRYAEKSLDKMGVIKITIELDDINEIMELKN